MPFGDLAGASDEVSGFAFLLGVTFLILLLFLSLVPFPFSSLFVLSSFIFVSVVSMGSLLRVLRATFCLSRKVRFSSSSSRSLSIPSSAAISFMKSGTSAALTSNSLVLSPCKSNKSLTKSNSGSVTSSWKSSGKSIDGVGFWLMSVCLDSTVGKLEILSSSSLEGLFWSVFSLVVIIVSEAYLFGITSGLSPVHAVSEDESTFFSGVALTLGCWESLLGVTLGSFSSRKSGSFP